MLFPKSAEGEPITHGTERMTLGLRLTDLAAANLSAGATLAPVVSAGHGETASTTTKMGLVVRAALDPRRYETGIAVSAAELAHLRITPARFHGDWNYSISPRRKNL